MGFTPGRATKTPHDEAKKEKKQEPPPPRPQCDDLRGCGSLGGNWARGWKVKVVQSCLTLCDPMGYTVR